METAERVSTVAHVGIASLDRDGVEHMSAFAAPHDRTQPRVGSSGETPIADATANSERQAIPDVDLDVQAEVAERDADAEFGPGVKALRVELSSIVHSVVGFIHCGSAQQFLVVPGLGWQLLGLQGASWLNWLGLDGRGRLSWRLRVGLSRNPDRLDEQQNRERAVDHAQTSASALPTRFFTSVGNGRNRTRARPR